MKTWLRCFLCLCMIALSISLWLQLHIPTNTSSFSFLLHSLQPPTPKQSSMQVQVTRQDGTIQTMDLPTYLEGVIGSEMPVSFEKEALKAQCVAARTFVAQREFQVDDTTSTQVYHDEEQLKQIWNDQYDANIEKIRQVIQETEDEVLLYDNAYISAVFYSSCHGQTNNAADYWSGGKPYLISVESPWDQTTDPNFETENFFTATELATILGFISPITSIQNISMYETGYVKEVTIDNKTFHGRELREALQLRSSAFTIETNEEGFIFHVKGYGHGIGMSQYGAQGMALEGYQYQEILEHYYPNTQLSKIK